MIKTGIFGGSFNPIHVGHIALAKAVLSQCALDEVWLMVSPQNPLKRDQQLLDDDKRLLLAQRALEGEPHVKVSDYEFHLPRPSYTWNTLQQLSRDYPDREFVLVIGGDNWVHFQRWRQWQNILWHHRVVVYPRGPYPGTIEVPLLPVSSTEIRRRVRQQQPVTGLVPPAIEQQVITYYNAYEQYS